MSTGVLEKIIAFSNGELDELPDGLERPGFFCDESWRWKTKMVYSESTGKMTTTSISESTGGKDEWNWWSPLYKKHMGTSEGCVNDGKSATFGFTSQRKDAKSITMCPVSFNYPKRYTLSAYRSGEKVVKDGTALQTYMFIPGILLHELAHLVTEGHVTDVPMRISQTGANGKVKIVEVKAYGAVFVAQLAKNLPDYAIINADNYYWFATAMYIDQCDWSRGTCAHSTATTSVSARSNN